MPGTLRQIIWPALHVSGETRPAPLKTAASTTGTAQRNGSLPKPRASTVRPGALWTTNARCNKQDVAKSIQEKILKVRSSKTQAAFCLQFAERRQKATCSIWPSARTCSGACRTCTGTCGTPSRPRIPSSVSATTTSGRQKRPRPRHRRPDQRRTPKCEAASVQADQIHRSAPHWRCAAPRPAATGCGARGGPPSRAQLAAAVACRKRLLASGSTDYVESAQSRRGRPALDGTTGAAVVRWCFELVYRPRRAHLSVHHCGLFVSQTAVANTLNSAIVGAA